ncbi:MAG: acyl-CoA desaturase [Cyclobacteriaceae bacterium]|jgi:stearoyl-CoA desaturase (delta-9 desaturase)|nr:acyl-CoA desaturase [Cytophagales bacterium]HNP76428.1 acyl-CoA desaturase [Cyclobacteriaceae bacterium]HQQ98053.1 acyl-CoA desaturase [Cyclobacteriaceae bacterium]
MLIILSFFVAHWYLSLFFQTFFLHRYAAHKAFTMSPFTEKVFFVLTWIFQGSNYLSPFGYGVMHRMHHAFADTENDPHSPKYDETIWNMMWKTKTIYSSIAGGRYVPESRFTEGVPQWEAFDKFARSWPSRLFWGALYVAFYVAFAPSAWYFLLLPVHFLMSPIHGAIINWFAHKYGYRNFEVGDTSRNFLPVDFLMMGESYHNNHHKHGSRPNFGGFRWHEIDPTYQVIKVLNKLGVIDMVKQKHIKIEPIQKAA